MRHKKVKIFLTEKDYNNPYLTDCFGCMYVKEKHMHPQCASCDCCSNIYNEEGYLEIYRPILIDVLKKL